MTIPNNKIAVVTGAAQGIGKAIACLMAEHVSRLLLLDCNEAHLLAIKSHIQNTVKNLPLTINTYTIDVTQEAQVNAVFNTLQSQYDRLDILINSVGGSSSLGRSDVLTEDMTLAQWQGLLDLNLTSSFLCCRAAIPLMKKNHYGRIINFSSIASHGRRDKASSAYAASKAGVEGFTRKVAREVAAFGITCNAIAPGITLTDRIDEKFWRTRSEIEKKTVLEAIPMQRLSSPEEQAQVALFLASDAASYLTGQIIEVSGGI